MKEYPILFKGPLVTAVLDGSKIQTRRLIKPQPETWLTSGRQPWNFMGRTWGWQFSNGTRACSSENTLNCPYGSKGDQLWVRETWARIEVADDVTETQYRADSGDKYPGGWPADEGADELCPKWKPSIHMRREYSRIQLEVTEVRVERLQDITEEDAQAEGLIPIPITVDCGPMTESTGGACGGGYITARESFATYWDAINSHRAPWASNPWVWVISFKRLRP